MGKIRKLFPDVHELRREVARQSPNFLSDIESQLGQQKDEYIRISARVNRGKFLLLASFFIFLIIFYPGFLDFFSVNNVFSAAVTVLVAIILSHIALKLMRDSNRVVSQFYNSFKNIIFSKTIRLFGLEGQRIDKYPKIDLLSHTGYLASLTKLSINDYLEQSELLTGPKNRVSVDDVMEISLEDRTLTVAEMSIKQGHGSRATTGFHGYFATIDLRSTLQGRTFISAEGDTSGFGHRQYWSDLLNQGALKTEFEWNDFENLLHVASTDPTEARYILAPDFMSELHDWWQEDSQNSRNIRVSFIGNRMYMLFPTYKIKMHQPTLSVSLIEVQDYVLSISEPLLRVLHLVEKVDK